MLLRLERLSLAQLRRDRGPGGDGALDLHATAVATVEVPARNSGQPDPGRVGRATETDAAVGGHLFGVGLHPIAGGQLHPRSHPVGRNSQRESSAQAGHPGGRPVHSAGQPSSHVKLNTSCTFVRPATLAEGPNAVRQIIVSNLHRYCPPYPPLYCLNRRGATSDSGWSIRGPLGSADSSTI